MRQIGLIVTVAALVAALAFLNIGIHKNARGEHDDQAQPPAQKQGPAPRQALQPEETIGNMASAKYKITAGWVYDSLNQKDPTRLQDALSALRMFAQLNPRTVAAEIVNLDVPVPARSHAAKAVREVGIRLNGKPIQYLTHNPGEGTTLPSYIQHMLPEKIDH